MEDQFTVEEKFMSRALELAHHETGRNSLVNIILSPLFLYITHTMSYQNNITILLSNISDKITSLFYNTQNFTKLAKIKINKMLYQKIQHLV
jgi:hypothetical protein